MTLVLLSTFSIPPIRVKCMRCRKLLPEFKMHKIMRFHDSGLNFNQIQIEFKYYVAQNIGKRFMGYMCTDCWGTKNKSRAHRLLRNIH